MSSTKLIILLLFYSLPSLSQISTDRLNVSSNSINWLDEKLTEQNNEISIGIGSRSKVISSTTTPYLEDNWTNGTIFYRGELFKNIKLLFDIEQNQVITKNEFTFFPIKLYPSQISFFILAGRKFVPITLKSQSQKKFFVEEVYKSKDVGIYFHFEKNVRIINNANQYYIDRTILLWSSKNKNVTSIDKKKDLLQMFKQDKPRLKRFFKENDIKRLENCSNDKFTLLGKFLEELDNA